MTVSCGSISLWCLRRKACIVAMVPVLVPLSNLNIADMILVHINVQGTIFQLIWEHDWKLKLSTRAAF